MMRTKDIQDGDKRIRSGFLIFSKSIEGQTRWLEYAEWEEEFRVCGIAGEYWWAPLKWLNK